MKPCCSWTRYIRPMRRGPSGLLGRQRINIHGAVDLQTGQTRMIEVEAIDALSTIKLLESIEALYPLLVCIHVFLDNARYHHAKLVQEWLSRRDCRITLHFIPTYLLPALEPDRAAMGRYALSQWLHAGLTGAGFATELLETRHVKAAPSAMTVKTDRKVRPPTSCGWPDSCI
jgi:hypothetical protein